jgi:hypothetical protein
LRENEEWKVKNGSSGFVEWLLTGNLGIDTCGKGEVGLRAAGLRESDSGVILTSIMSFIKNSVES